MSIQELGNVVPVQAVRTKAAVERVVSAEVLKSSATEKSASPEEIKASIASINQNLQKDKVNLDFSIDKATHISVVKVTDSVSGEIIMQFPSKAVIAVSEAITNKQSGAFLKENA